MTSSYVMSCDLEDMEAKQAALDLKMQEHERKLAELLPHTNSTPELTTAMEKYIAAKAEADMEAEQERQEDLNELRNSWPAYHVDLLKAYQATQNPLFLWRIYNTARFLRVTIPDDVYRYLDTCAQELLRYASSIRLDETISKKGSRKADAGTNCLKALGLHKNSKLNAFADMRRYMAQTLLIQDIEKVERENLANGMKPLQAKTAAVKDIHTLQEKYRKDRPISLPALRDLYEKHKSS